MAAACSKVRAAGFSTRWSAGAEADSAKAPVHQPKTASPGLEAGDVLADGFDVPCDIDAPDGRPRRAPATEHRADDERAATHDVPVEGVDTGRTDPDQHLVVADLESSDLLEPQHVGRAVPVLGDRFHGRSSLTRDGHTL